MAEPSVFLLSADSEVGELLELPQGCQGPFRGPGGKVRFLSRRLIGKGPQLAWRGESPGFSRVAAGFFSSYNGELRDRIVGPQGGPVSTRISRAPYGFLCNRCRGQGPHLELRPEPQGSSPVLIWNSGFLCAGFQPPQYPGVPSGEKASAKKFRER